MSSTPIRTFIVDDHPATRAGVAAVLDQDEDIAVVGAASGGRQMRRTLGPADPDVVLIDFDLDGEDGSSSVIGSSAGPTRRAWSCTRPSPIAR